jgi:transmembrane sensor
MSKIDNEAFEWVARKFARGLSESESAAFGAWLETDIRHKGAYARAMAIYNAINLATVPQSIPAGDGGHAAADDPVPAHRGFPRRQFLRREFLIYGGMAAGIAAAVGTMGLFPQQREAVLITARGELRKVPLQDKSIATINSGSRIEVEFTDKQRMVKLREGEAWFEVAKDKSKPFIVEAGDARVRAVGTAFSVRRFADGAEVLVTEGTVEVWTTDASARRRQLSAGERVFLGPRASGIAVVRQPGEVKRKLAWREGKLILKNQTLNEAVADFNRYSPKTIVILDAALGSKRLFGQYQLDAPELFAKDVSTILGVPLVITADRIYIGQPKGDQRGI